MERLPAYGLCERQVQGDGNCQFRALSDQLFGSQDYHRLVRGRSVLFNRLRSRQQCRFPQIVYAQHVAVPSSANVYAATSDGVICN